MKRFPKSIATFCLLAFASLPAAGQVGDVKANPNTGALISPSASAFRSANGLAIGTNVQAYDADLTTWAGITPSASVQTLLGSADYAALRTTLALVIGTNVQAYDADLGLLAAVTPTTKGDLLAFTGSAWNRLPAGANGYVLTADSAQTPGMRWAAASGGTISEPNVAYVNSSGNNTTGTGSINAPYLTLQKAFNDGFRIFEIGTGTYGLTTPGAATLYIRGRGYDNTSVSIVSKGALIIHELGQRSFTCYASTKGGSGSAAFNCTLYGVSGYTADTTGSDGEDEGQNGGDGATLTIYGPCTWIALFAQGGNAAPDPSSANGGNAGQIALIGQVRVLNDIAVAGGIASGAGATGSDGTITLRNGPDIPAPIPDSASVVNAVIAGVHYGNSYP